MVLKLIISIPFIGIRYHMPRRRGSLGLVDLVKLALENKDSQAAALTYESLYEKVSELDGGKPSRRDFQAALDQIENDNSLVVEKDPSDRRRVRIWRGAKRLP